MLSFISVVGLFVAVIIFLNLLSAGSPVTRTSPSDPIGDRPRLDPKKVYNMKAEGSIPRPRICPVCGTLLTQKEYLIASIDQEREGQKRQAHIYGCPHCFTSDGVNLKMTRIEP